MMRRTDKELIRIALDNSDRYLHDCDGLCNFFVKLLLHDLITSREEGRLHFLIGKYIRRKSLFRFIYDKRRVKKYGPSAYYWTMYDAKSRIKYLEYIHEKLR